ncbi:hypothetical protein SUGI_0791220 [Cryptomeria japonica]|nr:hypothetical protein SUGI_0791220 [Cryptomeria japonica]
MTTKYKEVLARKEEKNEEDLETDNISTHVSNFGNGPIDLTQEMMPEEVEGNANISTGPCEKILAGTCSKCEFGECFGAAVVPMAGPLAVEHFWRYRFPGRRYSLERPGDTDVLVMQLAVWLSCHYLGLKS